MIPRSALLLLAGALSAGAVIPAAAPAPAPAAPEPAAVDTAGFHLKNRSTFLSAESTRPPFWPIGWTKQGGGAATTVSAAPSDVKFDPEQYLVTSILLGRPSLAVINGRSYAEGEFVRGSKVKGALPAAGKVQVGHITDGNVVLMASGKPFSVPLRRPQLSEHKSDETLLSNEQ